MCVLLLIKNEPLSNLNRGWIINIEPTHSGGDPRRWFDISFDADFLNVFLDERVFVFCPRSSRQKERNRDAEREDVYNNNRYLSREIKSCVLSSKTAPVDGIRYNVDVKQHTPTRRNATKTCDSQLFTVYHLMSINSQLAPNQILFNWYFGDF